LADQKLDPAAAANSLATWEKIDSVVAVRAPPEIEVPGEIEALLQARQEARKARDFKRADAIRDELSAKGWTIEDTPKGPRLRRI
jgi:cysteinyl-tRNA synthetase